MDDAIRMLAEKFNCYLCIDDRILSEQNGMESEIENRFELGESLSLIQIPAESTIRLLESDDVRQVTTAIFSGESFETISQSVSRQSFSFRLPSIFATQMEVATPGIAAATMSQIACVLVSDRSNFWKVFTTLSVSESWQDIGLPNQPSASESS